MTRVARAYIGRLDPVNGTVPAANAVIDVSGPVTVSAKTTGDLFSLVLGGALSYPDNPETPPQTTPPDDRIDLTLLLTISVAVNVIDNTTDAHVDSAKVDATGLSITATSEPHAQSVVVAASVSFSKPPATNVSIATFNLDLAIAGAVAVNVFDGNTRATLTRSDVTTTDGGNVALLATDDTDIEADGGGFAIAISLGENAKGGTRGSLSVAVGVSVAVNDVDNTVVAQIGDSRVNAAGDITVDADSTTSIKAVTIAGAISGSGPSGTATPSTNIQIAGAGAGSGNSVDNDIEASIVGSASTPAPAIQAGGGIRVEATDLSTIEADAGGVAIAFAVSKDSSMFSLALGLSAAKNDITNTVDAKITGSTVLAKGKLEGTGDGVLVRANSTSTIKALTLAGAGVSGGIAGSGAGSGNDIANDITSQISGSSNVEAQDGTLIVAAEDTPTIKADAGALSIAITITSNNPNTVRLAAGIGITVAINDIENDVRAIVDGSVAKAKGNASVTAFSRPSIEVFSLSGTGGGSIDTGQSGGTLAVAFFGAGTGSGNEIDNIVEALVRNGATLESTDGTATVSATMPTPASGGATIVAKAVGVAVSVNVSNSTVNLSIAIGIAVAVNAIGQDATRGNIVRAKVTGATVKSKSGVVGRDVGHAGDRRARRRHRHRRPGAERLERHAVAERRRHRCRRRSTRSTRSSSRSSRRARP